MKNQPKFCRKCGQELVYELVTVGYYAHNGMPRTIQDLKCPNYDGFGSLHDWYHWDRPFFGLSKRWIENIEY